MVLIQQHQLVVRVGAFAVVITTGHCLTHQQAITLVASNSACKQHIDGLELAGAIGLLMFLHEFAVLHFEQLDQASTVDVQLHLHALKGLEACKGFAIFRHYVVLRSAHYGLHLQRIRPHMERYTAQDALHIAVVLTGIVRAVCANFVSVVGDRFLVCLFLGNTSLQSSQLAFTESLLSFRFVKLGLDSGVQDGILILCHLQVVFCHSLFITSGGNQSVGLGDFLRDGVRLGLCRCQCGFAGLDFLLSLDCSRELVCNFAVGFSEVCQQALFCCYGMLVRLLEFAKLLHDVLGDIATAIFLGNGSALSLHPFLCFADILIGNAQVRIVGDHDRCRDLRCFCSLGFRRHDVVLSSDDVHIVILLQEVLTDLLQLL